MNTPEHVGVAQQVRLDDRTWTLGRWRRREWKAFIDWARPFIPNPRTVCDEQLKVVPPDQGELRASLVKQATIAAVRYLHIGSAEVNELLQSTEGLMRLVFILLKEHHADAVADEEAGLDIAYEIATRVDAMELQKKLAACAGVAPPKDVSPGVARATINHATREPMPAV